ncbi:PD-(D/E)XK motif protein [Geobacter sp. FeAm09]|uniref:PD-(D/E)XK motif protein n=1 Tax=Geobacter sp. FeAm09 TaxID=2597769 RepID=UPI00143D7123|nr:PD-(D/E)XK motif protein [Geobacter sp. FeAm09]
MAEWVTADAWANLREGLSSNQIIREYITNNGQQTSCALAVDDNAKLHLMIHVPDESIPLPPDLNNITIRYVDIDCLVVDVAADASLEAVINPVFDAIISGCVDGRHPVQVVADHLERIRKAFARAGSAISENKQIGLVGELIVMHRIIIPGIGYKAAFQWSGPLAERHDFVGEQLHLEVKSTTRSMDQHEISRLDQLRVPDGKRLLLASIQLERSVAGEFTIATLREDIIAALAESLSAVDDFERKMVDLGWHDGLVQSGTLLKFNLRALNVFAVEGQFPRLPDDYTPPRGVVAVNYTINVAACPIMEPDAVMTLVATM